MVAQGGINDHVRAQLRSSAKLLLEKAAVPSDGRTRDGEARRIVNPVGICDPRCVGEDSDGDNMYVMDMLVEENLEKMLQDPELCRQALTPHVPVEDAWREPRDGTVYREHPLFSVDRGAFAFQLYAGEHSADHAFLTIRSDQCGCQMIMNW